jgi:hypothetical protein
MKKKIPKRPWRGFDHAMKLMVRKSERSYTTLLLTDSAPTTSGRPTNSEETFVRAEEKSAITSFCAIVPVKLFKIAK